MTAAEQPSRIDWVDYAKGICIILVAMMHSTLGVEEAMQKTSHLGYFVEWARPFRMPDFFLISGLFLARRISAPWPTYADLKIVHFAYFYVLWMSIQFLLKGYGIYAHDGLGGLVHQFALAFIEPFGTLWFIYILAIFFAVVKLCQGVPPVVMFAAGACLQMLRIQTGWTVIDEFAGRFVYFYAGYWLAPHVFAFADRVRGISIAVVLAALAVWAAVNAGFVIGEFHKLPGISLALGFVGAMAVVSTSVLLSKSRHAGWLRDLGENSITVYLAFFVFMAATRIVLIKYAPWIGIDAIAAIVTVACVIGPVLLHFAVKNTALNFLFKRPRWARVETWGKGWHSAGHVKTQHSETR